MIHGAGSPTIYVVEDDDAVRRGLEFELNLHGFAVALFGSGEAMLQGLPQAPGCLVIDERLPGLSGLDTLRQLRAAAVDMPAVLITSHPKAALRDAAARVGVPILEKPLDGDMLISAINSLLRLSQR